MSSISNLMRRPPKAPLVMVRPYTRFHIDEIQNDGILSEIKVGLSGSDKFQFPKRFQADYTRVCDISTEASWRLSVADDNFVVDGHKISYVLITGFSKQAIDRGLNTPEELSASMQRVALERYGLELTSRPVGSFSNGDVNHDVEVNDSLLAELGLTPRTLWQGVFPPNHYMNHFSYSLTSYLAQNLFHQAFNAFRMNQLIDLIEVALPNRESEVGILVNKNIAQRETCRPQDFKKGGAATLEELDLALHLALIKDIVDHQARDAGLFEPSEDLAGLELFIRGQAYRQICKFFRGVAERMGEDGQVFQQMVDRGAFDHERDAITYDLKGYGHWPLRDLERDRNIEGTRLYLAYQGARVIEAYEKISGQQVTLDYLLNLPTPFDLFSEIEARYLVSGGAS